MQMPVLEKVLPCHMRLSGPPIQTSSFVRSRYWLNDGRPNSAVTVRGASSGEVACPVTVTWTLESDALGGVTLMAYVP